MNGRCSWLAGAAAAVGGVACSTLLGVEDLPAKSSESYCKKLEPPVTFCRDFDDGAPYDKDVDYWEAPSPNAIIGVDNQSSRSPPASMFSEVSMTSENVRRAYILYKYGTSARLIRLSFDLLIEQATTTPENAIAASLRFAADTPDEHGVSVNVTNTTAHLEEYNRANNQYSHYEFTIPPKLGTWSRYEVEIQTTTRHATAWIDGQRTVDTTLEGTWHPAPLIFSFGTFWVTATDGARVRLRHDNVVLDLK